MKEYDTTMILPRNDLNSHARQKETSVKMITTTEQPSHALHRSDLHGSRRRWKALFKDCLVCNNAHGVCTNQMRPKHSLLAYMQNTMWIEAI